MSDGKENWKRGGDAAPFSEGDSDKRGPFNSRFRGIGRAILSKLHTEVLNDKHVPEMMMTSSPPGEKILTAWKTRFSLLMIKLNCHVCLRTGKNSKYKKVKIQ